VSGDSVLQSFFIEYGNAYGKARYAHSRTNPYGGRVIRGVLYTVDKGIAIGQARGEEGPDPRKKPQEIGGENGSSRTDQDAAACCAER